MPKKMASIKEILAANIRENRRKKGLTQEKLAEMAGMSLHYLAMLEVANKFPSGEMLEKLAKALDIQTFQLFTPSSTPEGALLSLEQSILANLEKLIKVTIKQTFQQENKPVIGYSPKEELNLLRQEIEEVRNAIKEIQIGECKGNRKGKTVL